MGQHVQFIRDFAVGTHVFDCRCYTEFVRRIAAAALLLLLCALPMQPLLRAETQAGVPACCRRDGKHHCMMMHMAAGMDMPRSWMAQPCPYARLHHAVASAQLGLLVPLACGVQSFQARLGVNAELVAPQTLKIFSHAPRSPPQLSL